MFFLWPLVAGLGGLFVGAQVDNAVQSSASAPQIIDQSKTPWWVTYLIWGVIALIVYKMFIKKMLK